MSLLKQSKKFIYDWCYETLPDRINLREDYLRLNFKFPIPHFESIMGRIDFDNNNEFLDGIFSYKKARAGRFGICVHVSIEFDGNSYSVMQYSLLNQKLKGQNYARVDVYGKYYRLVDMGIIEPFLLDSLVKIWTCRSGEDPTITRIDYHKDMFYLDAVKVPDYTKYFDIPPNTKNRPFVVGNITQSWEIGGGSGKNTPRLKMRYYDKKIQIGADGLWILYADYLSWASVHRYELEFGSTFCRGFHYSELNQLKDKCKYYFGSDGKYQVAFYKYNSAKQINDLNYLTYYKSFISKGYKFQEAGYNPYLLLNKGLSAMGGEYVNKADVKVFLNSIKNK